MDFHLSQQQVLKRQFFPYHVFLLLLSTIKWLWKRTLTFVVLLCFLFLCTFLHQHHSFFNEDCKCTSFHANVHAWVHVHKLDCASNQRIQTQQQWGDLTVHQHNEDAKEWQKLLSTCLHLYFLSLWLFSIFYFTI